MNKVLSERIDQKSPFDCEYGVMELVGSKYKYVGFIWFDIEQFNAIDGTGRRFPWFSEEGDSIEDCKSMAYTLWFSLVDFAKVNVVLVDQHRRDKAQS